MVSRSTKRARREQKVTAYKIMIRADPPRNWDAYMKHLDRDERGLFLQAEREVFAEIKGKE